MKYLSWPRLDSSQYCKSKIDLRLGYNPGHRPTEADRPPQVVSTPSQNFSLYRNLEEFPKRYKYQRMTDRLTFYTKPQSLRRHWLEFGSERSCRDALNFERHDYRTCNRGYCRGHLATLVFLRSIAFLVVGSSPFDLCLLHCRPSFALRPIRTNRTVETMSIRYCRVANLARRCLKIWDTLGPHTVHFDRRDSVMLYAVM